MTADGPKSSSGSTKPSRRQRAAADGTKTSAYATKSAHRRRGEGTYRAAVRAFSVVMIGLGVALLATTIAAGGGPASVGVLMGIAFVAVGAGRLWLSLRMSR